MRTRKFGWLCVDFCMHSKCFLRFKILWTESAIWNWNWCYAIAKLVVQVYLPKALMSLWVASCLSLLSALVSTRSQYRHGYSFVSFLGDAVGSCLMTFGDCCTGATLILFGGARCSSDSPFLWFSLSSFRFWYCSEWEPRSCLLLLELDLNALEQNAQGYGRSSECTT